MRQSMLERTWTWVKRNPVTSFAIAYVVWPWDLMPWTVVDDLLVAALATASYMATKPRGRRA